MVSKVISFSFGNRQHITKMTTYCQLTEGDIHPPNFTWQQLTRRPGLPVLAVDGAMRFEDFRSLLFPLPSGIGALPATYVGLVVTQ